MKNDEKAAGLPARIIALIFVMLTVGLWPTAGVFAEQEHRGPCADDVAKFCKDIQPGGGGIANCLKEHENELSAGCKEHFSKMQERMGKAREACADDVAKFCKDVKPGDGGVMKCLKEHESELSTSCREHVAHRGKSDHESRGACRDDVQKFCKDVQPGRGGIMRCLKEHESELSAGCREKLVQKKSMK